MNKIIIMGVLLLLASTSFAYTWYDITASFRNNLTVENMGATALNNFPFLIHKNFTSFTSSCTDYKVINSSDNELLKYQMENNTCSVGDIAHIWASSPSLTANSNNTAGILYHNFTPVPSDTSSNPFDTTIYKHVFHLAELSGTFNDEVNASVVLNQTLKDADYGYSGYFGYGLRVNGSLTSQSGLGITNGTYSLNDTLITVEIWFNASDHTSRTLFGWSSTNCELAINPNQASGGGIRTYAGNNLGTIFDNFGTGGGATYTTGEWIYFVLKYDGARSYAYKNGVLIQNLQVTNANKSLCLRPSGMPLYIGSGGSGGLKGFNGTIDEVRVSSANLSDGYIASVWANRNGATIGADEPYVIQPPVISILDPSNITYTKFDLNLNISSDQIATYNYSLNDGANVSFIPNITFTGVMGSNKIIVWGTNENGTGINTVRFTINIPPTITILNPIATIYTDPNITLQVRFNDTDPSSFWYILNNGANVSFTPNTTFTASLGLNSISVHMNDTYGSIAHSGTVNFTVNTTYTPPINVTVIGGGGATDPNVLLFLVVLFLVVVGILFLAR